MTRPCPDHPRALGNTLGQCTACQREAAHTDHSAHIAAVRAALRNAPRPPIAREPTTPTRDLAIARKRADQENQHG